MKPWYKHHYDKVIVPFYVPFADISDHFGEREVEHIMEKGFEGCWVKVTVSREAPDPEDGITFPTYQIDDVDVQHSPLMSIFTSRITELCEDYVYDNENEILGSKKVYDAFEYADAQLQEAI